ncbi:site-specific integrase [Dysgonomonas macrotermitis]|uniref:Site-specific recombinase XerD n=1 Tax=Dysgonomonas macrotermitis TaxID=1346286 RepID=A0A1M4X9A2_9BACT|nr:site-specific integrase [Dysgonomonas macrotermitis]SHE90100.1 Site-specific recombinase XerD [Dysgonomonas macrotermitis]
MRRSTFKILFYIKRSNPKKNGKVAIMGRITIDGKRSQFSTKLEIYPDEWNNEWGKSIGNNAEAIAINSMLDKIRGKIVTYYYKLMDIDGYASPDKIKNILLGFEEKGKTIIYYFDKFNEQYRSKVGVTVRRTTYLRYELVKKRLSEFMEKTYKVKDMPYREITTVFIQNFYQFLRSKYKSGNNNAMKTIQHLRAIFFYIKNSGEYFPDPFANFKISFEKKERSFLTKAELIALYNKKLPSERLERVRDIFLFCSFTGLSYSDLQNLTKEKIRTNIDGHLWIMATRNKTGIPYKVRLLDIPIAILKKYEYLQEYGELLPIISNQKMNEYLSEITNICGINKRITSHCARHTFGTLCLTEGMSIESVSKLLGHTKIKTTQIYAQITDQKLSNEMDKLAKKLNIASSLK